MSSPDDGVVSDGPGAGAPEVTVRFWAALRAAAGLDGEQLRAATLADLMEQIRERHADDSRFLDIMGICSVLVGARPVNTRDPGSVPLADGDVVELLPPFAGG